MSDTPVLDRLKSFYPHLELDPIMNKVDASKESDFMFFRAFVPWYYDWMHKNTVLKGLKAGRRRYLCWCVGDPHLENFGVVLEVTGEGKRRVFTG